MENATSNAVGVHVPEKNGTVNPAQLEFLRLPPVGKRCPVTGLSRSALNELVLPCPKNDFKPPVKSYCLRQKGSRTGIRIISYPSLREYILAHEDNGQADQPENFK